MTDDKGKQHLEETSKKALGGASLMCSIAWEGIKAAAGKDLEGLRILEDRLRKGEATIAVFVQRDATTVYLSAAALPPGWQDAFEGFQLFRIQGPVISAIEELKRLRIVDVGSFN